VDLAGSERVKKSGSAGKQLKEAQSINKSLSAFADVIGSLSSDGQHIPYQNHKLTMLMSDYLMWIVYKKRYYTLIIRLSFHYDYIMWIACKKRYYTLISRLSFHYSNLYFNRLHFRFLFSTNKTIGVPAFYQ
jgi:hypothetical protein